MTPLLPWRPAILSPTESARFMATYVLTSLMTPGGSSSPRRIFSFFSSNSWRMTSTCRSVRSSKIPQFVLHPRVVAAHLDRIRLLVGQPLQHLGRQLGPLAEDLLAAEFVVEVGAEHLGPAA